MKNKYTEIIVAFFSLGLIAFGGPAAHIGLMEREFVQRRQWLSQDTFLQMIGFTNLIPGPNSTEMASLIGYHRAKTPGLLLAGVSFILPAFVLVLLLSMVYKQFESIGLFTSILQGITPVIVAVIGIALIRLSKKVSPTWITRMLFVLIVGLALFTSIHELWLLGLGAVLMIGIQRPSNALKVVEPFSLIVLFLTMLKIGSILYGGGYVLLAYFNADFVERLGWISANQLLDAVAIGQLTPGPIFTTATFIGFVLGDFQGAVLATIAIFAPSFLITVFLYPQVNKFKDHFLLKPILQGVSIASIALMAQVTWLLFDQSILSQLSQSLLPLIVFAVSFVVLFKTTINPALLMIGGALFGAFLL
jgi:chromate transporter